MERIQPLQVIVLIVSLISLFTLLQSLPIAVSVAETLHFLWKNNEFYNKNLFFDTMILDSHSFIITWCFYPLKWCLVSGIVNCFKDLVIPFRLFQVAQC